MNSRSNAELADLCRAAHDDLLTNGWGRGDSYRCIGAALARATETTDFNRPTTDAWRDWAGYPEELCPDGRRLQRVLEEILDWPWSDFTNWRKRPGLTLAHWNDLESRTLDDVLDLLLQAEKKLRDTEDTPWKYPTPSTTAIMTSKSEICNGD